MENRYSVHPEQVKRFTTEELRSHFLMDSLFTENKLTMYYSHEDRVVTNIPRTASRSAWGRPAIGEPITISS